MQDLTKLILKVLLDDDKKWWSVSEIAGVIKRSEKAISKELEHIHTAWFVISMRYRKGQYWVHEYSVE